MNKIIVATPHSRNDKLMEELSEKLKDFDLIRINDPSELTAEYLFTVKPTYIFFPHWSWIIPEDIYKNFKCVIFHMTDLPYGRGGSPLQNLIVRGHKKTMLSAIECVGDLDAGSVYQKKPLSLEGTAEEILKKASFLMEDMIINIVKNNPKPSPQIGEVVEFIRRKPEDGDIGLLKSLEKVYDHIRMLDADNYPSAFIETSELKLELTEAKWKGDNLEAKVKITRIENE